MKTIFKTVTDWQEVTFPNATSTSKLHHLNQELRELRNVNTMNDNNVLAEFADCFMLLFGVAKSEGLNFDKMIITSLSQAAGISTSDGVAIKIYGIRRLFLPELLDAIERGTPNIKILICNFFTRLFWTALDYGFTYDEIVEAINKKHQINLTRKWGEPDKNGVVNHIK